MSRARRPLLAIVWLLSIIALPAAYAQGFSAALGEITWNLGPPVEVNVEVRYQVENFTRFRVQIEEKAKPPRTSTTGWISINSKTLDARTGTSSHTLNFVLGLPAGLSVWELRVVLLKEPELIGSSQVLQTKEIQIPLGSVATTASGRIENQPDPVAAYLVVLALTAGFALYMSRRQKQGTQRMGKKGKVSVPKRRR